MYADRTPPHAPPPVGQVKIESDHFSQKNTTEHVIYIPVFIQSAPIHRTVNIRPTASVRSISLPSLVHVHLCGDIDHTEVVGSEYSLFSKQEHDITAQYHRYSQFSFFASVLPSPCPSSAVPWGPLHCQGERHEDGEHHCHLQQHQNVVTDWHQNLAWL